VAVKGEFESVTSFEDWYTDYSVDNRTGELILRGFTDCAVRKTRLFDQYKREMDSRVAKYDKYEKQAAAEVVSEKPDLPNISSGENAGFIRRIARNVVQHTPNVFIANEFDDDALHGIMARHLLKTKIIGDDEYSNDMQQNLITTARRGFAIGFDCVIPSLQQDSQGSWYVLYDTIHYRDVFPEPGCKDIRRAPDVYIRRYLTRGEVNALIRDQVPGWDIAALRTLLKTRPSSREYTDHESKKHHVNSEAYEIITWYSNSGDPFLTYDARMKLLLRIEKNKHPLKEHPVFFFIPEKDDTQPLGKSLLSLTYGRQEFQDLFLNGAMKLWWRNINPPIIGYGTVNAIPNLSPGKYTQISNPNAKVEAFEVNTNALMMFGQTSQQNAANMVQLLGAADQQMASQNTGGMMSQTPAGVEAQQQMVDITTNNYQKAMEQFFSRYCSYALTIYFQELKGTKVVTPSADARKELLDAGLNPEIFIHEPFTDDEGVKHPGDGTNLKDGQIKINFSEMATLYYVQCVPGSLTELEDEKQLRILQQIFVPLSQAMPALAQTGDQGALSKASAAMQYIVQKTIELSGSSHANELTAIFKDGPTDASKAREEKVSNLELALGGAYSELAEDANFNAGALLQLRADLNLVMENQAKLLQALGVGAPGGQPVAPTPEGPAGGGQTPEAAAVAVY
jgi:hypothetical protein